MTDKYGSAQCHHKILISSWYGRWIQLPDTAGMQIVLPNSPHLLYAFLIGHMSNGSVWIFGLNTLVLKCQATFSTYRKYFQQCCEATLTEATYQCNIIYWNTQNQCLRYMSKIKWICRIRSMVTRLTIFVLLQDSKSDLIIVLNPDPDPQSKIDSVESEASSWLLSLSVKISLSVSVTAVSMSESQTLFGVFYKYDNY